jgi:hypothetical protein
MPGLAGWCALLYRILHRFDDRVIFLYLELKFNIMDINRAA